MSEELSRKLESMSFDACLLRKIATIRTIGQSSCCTGKTFPMSGSFLFRQWKKEQKTVAAPSFLLQIIQIKEIQNMSKVLYIKANPKEDADSRTFRISESFIDTYRKLHPEDEIITLDLYKEHIDFLSAESVSMHKMAPDDARSHPVLKYAYQ